MKTSSARDAAHAAFLLLHDHGFARREDALLVAVALGGAQVLDHREAHRLRRAEAEGARIADVERDDLVAQPLQLVGAAGQAAADLVADVGEARARADRADRTWANPAGCGASIMARRRPACTGRTSRDDAAPPQRPRASAASSPRRWPQDLVGVGPERRRRPFVLQRRPRKQHRIAHPRDRPRRRVRQVEPAVARWRTCGSAKTCARSLIGPHGTWAACEHPRATRRSCACAEHRARSAARVPCDAPRVPVRHVARVRGQLRLRRRRRRSARTGRRCRPRA